MVEVGKCYHHFKGKDYKVIAIAKDSENLELVVVYQALYGDGDVWVRSLKDFTSKVDKAKYPDFLQEYRFEEIKS